MIFLLLHKSVWLDVGRACVGFGSLDQLRLVFETLKTRWKRPMLRSTIDLCQSLSEAIRKSKILTKERRLEFKVNWLLIA